jgi:hypothetical protein
MAGVLSLLRFWPAKPLGRRDAMAAILPAMAAF